ncbi:CSAD decarboxylase, partial [Tricholaema leucomelas]|nr:CSAD decarboxylase [Tricholaema leucomelas]
SSRYTYEVAPVFVLMEEVVLAKLRELVGWSRGDGIFAPGGSISNMFAINLARFQRFPECRRRGNWALPRLVLFASQEVGRGKGADKIWGSSRTLPPPPAPDPPQLLGGAEPFLVCATSGTTVLGAFDPLDAIADICQRHSLWLHVDAAWGGSALLSSAHRHLLAGIERANSVTWNPHKLLGVGLQCSALLLPDTSVVPPQQGLLQRCHGAGASYLFQPDKFYDATYDPGDKTPQCGRRVDCLKLWLLWKAIGTQGLAQRVQRALDATRYLTEQVKRREGFQLVLEPEFINLCFWFVPPSLRGREGSSDYWSCLGKVAPVLKERMMKAGSMLLSYQPHGTKVNFFRQIVTSPAVTKADLDFLLDELERLGGDL